MAHVFSARSKCSKLEDQEEEAWLTERLLKGTLTEPSQWEGYLSLIESDGYKAEVARMVVNLKADFKRHQATAEEAGTAGTAAGSLTAEELDGLIEKVEGIRAEVDRRSKQILDEHAMERSTDVFRKLRNLLIEAKVTFPNYIGLSSNMEVLQEMLGFSPPGTPPEPLIVLHKKVLRPDDEPESSGLLFEDPRYAGREQGKYVYFLDDDEIKEKTKARDDKLRAAAVAAAAAEGDQDDKMFDEGAELLAQVALTGVVKPGAMAKPPPVPGIPSPPAGAEADPDAPGELVVQVPGRRGVPQDASPAEGGAHSPDASMSESPSSEAPRQRVDGREVGFAEQPSDAAAAPSGRRKKGKVGAPSPKAASSGSRRSSSRRQSMEPARRAPASGGASRKESFGGGRSRRADSTRSTVSQASRKSGAPAKQSQSALFAAATQMIADEETQLRRERRRRRRSGASALSMPTSSRAPSIAGSLAGSHAPESVLDEVSRADDVSSSSSEEPACPQCRVLRDALLLEKMKNTVLWDKHNTLHDRLNVKEDEPPGKEDMGVQCVLLDPKKPVQEKPVVTPGEPALQPSRVASSPAEPEQSQAAAEERTQHREAMRRLNADLFAAERTIRRLTRVNKAYYEMIQKREACLMATHDRWTEARRRLNQKRFATRGAQLWALVRRKVRTLATHRRAMLLSTAVLSLKGADSNVLLDAVSLLDSVMQQPPGAERKLSKSAAALYRAQQASVFAKRLRDASNEDERGRSSRVTSSPLRRNSSRNVRRASFVNLPVSRKTSALSAVSGTGKPTSDDEDTPGSQPADDGPTMRQRRHSSALLHGNIKVTESHFKLHPEKRIASTVYQLLLQHKTATGFQVTPQHKADMETFDQQYLAALNKQDEALAKQIGLIIRGCGKDDRVAKQITDVKEGIEQRQKFLEDIEERLQAATSPLITGIDLTMDIDMSTLPPRAGSQPAAKPPLASVSDADGQRRSAAESTRGSKDRSQQLSAELDSVGAEQNLREAHKQLAEEVSSPAQAGTPTTRDRSPSFDQTWMKDDLLKELSQMRTEIVRKDSEIRALETQLEMHNVRLMLVSGGSNEGRRESIRFEGRAPSFKEPSRPPTEGSARPPRDRSSATAALTLAMMEYDSMSEDRDLLSSRGGPREAPSRVTSPVLGPLERERKPGFAGGKRRSTLGAKGRRKSSVVAKESMRRKQSTVSKKDSGTSMKDKAKAKDMDVQRDSKDKGGEDAGVVFIDQKDLFPSRGGTPGSERPAMARVDRRPSMMSMAHVALADCGVQTEPPTESTRSAETNTEPLEDAELLSASMAESARLRDELSAMKAGVTQLADADAQAKVAVDATRAKLEEDNKALREVLREVKVLCRVYISQLRKTLHGVVAFVKDTLPQTAAAAVNDGVVSQFVEAIGGDLMAARLLWYHSEGGGGKEAALALARKKSLKGRAQSAGMMKYEAWQAPEVVEDYLNGGDKWTRDRTGSKHVDAKEQAARAAWYDGNFWKATRFVQSFRDGWLPTARDKCLYPKGTGRRSPGDGHYELLDSAPAEPEVPPFVVAPDDTFVFESSNNDMTTDDDGRAPAGPLPLRGPGKVALGTSEDEPEGNDDGMSSRSHSPPERGVTKRKRTPNERAGRRVVNHAVQLSKMLGQVDVVAKGLMKSVMYPSEDSQTSGGARLTKGQADKLIKSTTSHLQALNAQQEQFYNLLNVLKHAPTRKRSYVKGAAVARGDAGGGALSSQMLVLPEIYSAHRKEGQPVSKSGIPQSKGADALMPFPEHDRHITENRHQAHPKPVPLLLQDSVTVKGFDRGGAATPPAPPQPAPPLTIIAATGAPEDVPANTYMMGAMPIRGGSRAASRASRTKDDEDDEAPASPRSMRGRGSACSRAMAEEDEAPVYPEGMIPIPEAQSHRYSLIPSPPGGAKTVPVHARSPGQGASARARLAATDPQMDPVVVFPLRHPDGALPLSLSRYTNKASPPAGHGAGRQRRTRLRQGKALAAAGQRAVARPTRSPDGIGFSIGPITPAEHPLSVKQAPNTEAGTQC
eukprot:TRINITY_DN5376_c0_g1_i1.p1 TRINITY_DN5376_c0_g1~~TRINITY_DN5376_c0_g1_i1.p1  ORF type:complete len:2035 (+),score=563.27 TRINITY_DN5376_c0_g1_i1:86-6190(+)